MSTVPLPFQTLYADLLQQVGTVERDDALLDARSRGRDGWERPIVRSMRAIRDTLAIDLAGS